MQPYILVIEDDPTLGKVPLRAAGQLDLKAVLDENGDQYPALIREHGIPALVLLDLHLPYASGAHILQHLRAGYGLQQVPIIIMTADIIQARDMEMQGERVLLKPVNLNRLQEIYAEQFNITLPYDE